MAVLAIQDASEGLNSVAFGAAAAGDQVESGAVAGGWALGGVVLLAKNADTLATRGVTVNGRTITIPISGQGALPVKGAVGFDVLDITYTGAVADISVAAVRLGRV